MTQTDKKKSTTPKKGYKKLAGTEVQKIEKYNSEKPARISQALYEFERTRWRLSTHAMRLLVMVSQTVSKQPADQADLFPLEYPLDTVFKYLGLGSTGQKYNLLAKACEDFGSKFISTKTVTPRGATRWSGFSLITSYEFSDDPDYPALRIKVNPDAKQFMCELHQYAMIQPKYIVKLTTEYQNWFYPYLKMRHTLGRWEVSIKDMLFMLYLEKTPSYTTMLNANVTFMNRVIGITKPKGWKFNPDGPNKPWDYTKDKGGNFTGTLASISEKTDINVSAYPIMEKGKYVAIHFDISVKAAKLTRIEQEQLHKKAAAQDVHDMGKPERKGRSKARKPQTMGDLFKGIPLVEEQPNPMFPSADTPAPMAIRTDEEFRAEAKAMGMTVEELAKAGHFRRTPEGNWVH